MKVVIALLLAAATCLLFQISTLAFADSRTVAANTEPGIRLDIEHLDLDKPEVVAGAIRQANAPGLTALHQLQKRRGDIAGYQGQAVRPQ